MGGLLRPVPGRGGTVRSALNAIVISRNHNKKEGENRRDTREREYSIGIKLRGRGSDQGVRPRRHVRFIHKIKGKVGRGAGGVARS